MVPKRQFKIVIDDGVQETLFQFVGEFARKHRFKVFCETFRSAPSAPAVFWTLERFEGMIVFQNSIVGEEPDPEYPGLTLDRHSQTEFSAMFYRSMFGYDNKELEQLISLFGTELLAIDGVGAFYDQFPRTGQ